MSVSLRANTSLTGASGTSWSSTIPVTVEEGDLMIFPVYLVSSATNILQVTSGWLQLPDGSLNGDDNIAVWYKYAEAGDAGGTVTATSSGSEIAGVGIIALYSTADLPLLIEDVSPAFISVASGNRTFAAVELSAAGYVICVGHLGGSFSSTPPGGMSEFWDTTVSGSRAYAMGGTASSGTAGPYVATGSSSTAKLVTIGVIEGTPITVCPRIRAHAVTGPLSLTGSIAVTIPSSVEEGDLLFLHLGLVGDRTVGSLSDWTEVQSTSGAFGSYLYSKIADVDDPGSSVTMTYTGSNTVGELTVTAIYSPNGKSLRIDASVESSLSSASSHTFPSVTPLATNNLWLMFAVKAGTNGYILNDGTSRWRRFDSGLSSMRMSVLYDFHLPSTATGTYTAPLASGSITANVVSLVVVEYDPPSEVISGIYPSEQNLTVVYHSFDVTKFLRMGNLLGPVPALDTTTLADADPTSIPGSPPWVIELEGFADKETDDLLGVDALRNGRSATVFYRTLVISFGPVGNQTIFTWAEAERTGAFVADYALGPSTEFAEVPFRASLLTSGAPTREAG